MILLWGISGDTPLQLVREALEHRHAEVLFLDQLSPAHVEIDADECLERGALRIGARSIELEAIRSAYIRPYPVSMLQRRGDGYDDTLLAWCEETTALIVNRPSAMTPNHSKPYQSSLIRAFGFDTPETLITTDPAAALAFWERHGSVVYKSISSVRSIVGRLTAGHRERLADVRHCPTQFQEHIPGIDYRVHVVGNECFACEIVSTADDYRYAARSNAGLEIRSCRMPDALTDRCRAIAAGTDLHVAGIDLRRTPDDGWYCFEVNPSPAFSFYEETTGQPLSEAVARLLLGQP